MITALCRTVILYFLIMIGLRLMGKRQIGELEPSELVLTMMISDLATVPMQDFGIPLLAGVIPILILLSLTLLMSQLSLLNLRFRALMCGTPAILIRNGKLQQAAMRKNRYTLDELLEQLRGQGCLSVEEVQYAVLENSGQLSVLPWAKAKPPAAEDLGLTLEEESLPTVLINDGRVLRNNLRLCGRDEVWLQKILKQEHCTTKAFSLWNIRHMEEETNRWREQLQTADRLALCGEWAEALDALWESYDDWSHSQTYLHIVSHHDAVDDAEAMYRRAIAFGETEGLSEFHAELSDLRDQLRLIAEMEALNIRNVL